MLVMRSHNSCASNLDLNSDFYRFGVSQFRKGSLNLKFQRLFHHHHHRFSSYFALKVILENTILFSYVSSGLLIELTSFFLRLLLQFVFDKDL